MKCIIGQQNRDLRKQLKEAVLTLRPSAQIVECDSWDCALLDLIKKGTSDFLFLDLNILGASWIQRTQELMKLQQQTKLVLTGKSIDPAVLMACFENGIAGFIPHDEFGLKLHSVLALIFDFGIYVPPFFIKKPQPALSENAKYRLPNGEIITKRQMQVLFYLKDGYFNKQIAQKMNVKEPTIKLHIHNLFQKLNANNRTQIVIKAHQLGLF